MKKHILSVVIVLSLITIILLSITFFSSEDEESYPYIEVQVDTLDQTENCGSRIEYSILGSGYFNIGFAGYKLEKKVLLGWKDIDIESTAYTMPLVRYPYESTICTKNELENGTYRITTIMRESSKHEPINATFKIE